MQLNERRIVRTGEVNPSVLADELAQAVRDTLGLAERDCLHLSMAIYEALVNAIDHGNLQLSSALIRDDPAAAGDPYEDYARERSARLVDPRYAGRQIRVDVRTGDRWVQVTVADEGAGFDCAQVADPRLAENLARPYGRGLLLIRSLMDEVRFNRRGNAITMTRRFAGEA